MTKRVFLLMSLAILAVVWSHAAGWGQIAMFAWTDRYRPVTVPNFDQLGSLSYYVLLVIRQLTVWAVPAFVFVSGFFVAYAARGRQSVLSWKVVRVRIINLLVPYTIWSVMCFIGDALDGITYTPLEYLERLVSGKADGPYFYVPFLCQFYLLAPLLVAIAKTRGRPLLLGAGLLQLGALSLRYRVLLGVEISGLHLIAKVVTQSWLFFTWSFFFPFGIECGLHVKQLKGWLTQHKWSILVATIILGLLAILEPEVVYRTTGREWRFVPLTITTSLYAVAFVLCFLAFDKISTLLPTETIRHLGRRSYGIYLLHMRVISFVARVIRQVAPWMLAHQVLLIMPVTLAVGLGIPLLFMAFVNRSPARRSYRYLFG